MIFAAEPPLDPDAPTARRWLREELAKPAYHESVSWQERLDRWIAQHLPEGVSMAGSQVGAAVLITVLLITVALIAWQVRRFRGGSRQRSQPGSVFEDTTLSAREHRRRAEQALAGGDNATAVVEYFRAIARDLEERTIITPRAGRTAHEVALEAGPLLPGQVDSLRAAADTFDSVLYGGLLPDASRATQLRDIDAAVRATRAQHRNADHSDGGPGVLEAAR